MAQHDLPPEPGTKRHRIGSRFESRVPSNRVRKSACLASPQPRQQGHAQVGGVNAYRGRAKGLARLTPVEPQASVTGNISADVSTDSTLSRGQGLPACSTRLQRDLHTFPELQVSPEASRLRPQALKTFIGHGKGALHIDSDQIQPPLQSARWLERSRHDRRDLLRLGLVVHSSLQGGRPGTGSARNVVTAVAAAIINSYVVTRWVIVTVIVTVSVLMAALALELVATPPGRPVEDLEDGLHNEASSTAYLVEARTEGSMSFGRSEAAERAARRSG